MDVITTRQISSRPIEKVILHPLVLLRVVDNYSRVAKDTRKRVVGVLLGTVDVNNSCAVPFEEDEKDPSIWFLDHNYHEPMFSMFKRRNAKEHVVGWYSTGPKHWRMTSILIDCLMSMITIFFFPFSLCWLSVLGLQLCSKSCLGYN